MPEQEDDILIEPLPDYLLPQSGFAICSGLSVA